MYTKSEARLLKAMCAADIAPRPMTFAAECARCNANDLWKRRRELAERGGRMWVYARCRVYAKALEDALAVNGLAWSEPRFAVYPITNPVTEEWDSDPIWEGDTHAEAKAAIDRDWCRDFGWVIVDRVERIADHGDRTVRIGGAR